MNGGRGFLTHASTYYQDRRKKHRPVFQIGSTNLRVTVGQVGSTTAGLMVAIVAHAPSPLWLAGIIAGGLAAGSYFFPIPEGGGKFRLRSEDELEAMAPGDVRTYMYQLRVLEMPLADPIHVLRRQAQAANLVKDRNPSLAAADMSLLDLRAWLDASYRHERTLGRWSRYELDPALQIRFPAMADIREEPTAAMIRAMKRARNASDSGTAQDYASAVDQLAHALAAAEAHARKQ